MKIVLSPRPNVLSLFVSVGRTRVQKYRTKRTPFTAETYNNVLYNNYRANAVTQRGTRAINRISEALHALNAAQTSIRRRATASLCRHHLRESRAYKSLSGRFGVPKKGQKKKKSEITLTRLSYF